MELNTVCRCCLLAAGPDGVADVLLRGIGRSVIIDQGYYPFALRVLLRIIELTWLTDVMAIFAGSIGDYKYLKVAQAKKA